MFIRWSRLIPRLLLLAVLSGVAWWFLDDLIRWQLRWNLERQTGAAVEIDSVRTDLPGGRLTIGDVRLFDPNSPEKELFRAEKIVAQGVPDDMLKRYFNISQLDVEGIHIAVDGVDGQSLVPDRLWTQFKERVPGGIEMIGDFDWSAFLTEKPEIAAMTLLRQFETSRLAEELKQRWPNEIDQFEKFSTLIRSRFQKIKLLLEQPGGAEEKIRLLGDVLGEFEETDREIRQMVSKMSELKTRAQGDYQTLLETAKRDQASLKQLRAPSIDADQLTQTLIGPEIKEQWDKTVAWGDWARSLLVPVEMEDGAAPIYERFGLHPPKRFRGETIHLTSLDARPELLVGKTNLSGQIVFGTIPVYFNGTVNNVAHSMSLGPEPTIAQFCFSGTGIPTEPIMPVDEQIVASQIAAVVDPNILPNLYVTLTIDRLGRNEEDQLIVRCPMYRLPERILGDPERLAIAVSPGVSSLDGVLMLNGENLSGQIRIVQSDIRLSVLLPEKLRQSSLHRLLQQTLDTLNRLTAEVLVSGTRSKPTYVFKSNVAETIGPQIASLIQNEWSEVLQKAESEVTLQANRAVETLNTSIRDKIDPMMNEINAQRAAWEQQIVQGSGLPLDQLIQTQMSRLSQQDRDRLNQFMSTPTVQALLQNGASQAPADPGRQVDQLIQQGVDKIQDKIPGLLERLKRSN